MALAEMLADPQTRRLLLEDLVGPLFPIQGGACTFAADVGGGTPNDRQFGFRCLGGDFSFPANVGIGTTPTTVLDILDNGTGLRVLRAGNDLRLVNDGVLGNSYVGTESNSKLVLRTNAANRVTIDESGRVGIGTLTPATVLDIVDNGTGLRVLRAGNDLRLVNDGVLGNCYAGSVSNSKFVLITNNLNRVTIDESGRVGIGTTGPARRLHVLGAAADDFQARLEAAAGKSVSLEFYEGATNRGLIAAGATSFDLYNGDVAGGPRLSVRQDNGNVGIGMTGAQAKLNVRGNASFAASGTVSVTINSKTVTGSGTSFLSQIAVGDRISVTIGGTTYTRTVTAIASNTSLTVDATYTTSAGSLTMTARPSLFRCDASSGNRQLMVDDDGFVGLAGTAVNDNDGVGYVICNADKTFLNPNNEMRGYQATMRYTRNNSVDANVVYGFKVNTSGTAVTWVSGPDGAQFITTGAWNNVRIDITESDGVTRSYYIQSVTDATHLTLTASAGTQSNRPAAVWQTSPTTLTGNGWDVLGHVAAVSLEDMNLPAGDPNIRGQMKPFQSELRLKAKAPGAANYNVVAPTLNYVASLFAVDPTCTIKNWAGYYVDSPCSECGAPNAVETGYGIWVADLKDSPTPTLVAANAAAIKIDGKDEYGRIFWGSTSGPRSSVYCPSSGNFGVLEFHATTAVQTASGVPFNGGSYINTPTGYRVGGAAASGNYLRGDGTNFVSGAIQAADVPNLDASKITSGVLDAARIPSLDASKITSGTMDAARLPVASASASGIVNTFAQAFAGLKTFQDGVDGSGANAGVRHRHFAQNTRPTLNAGETAFWYRPSDNEAGLLHNDGTNYFWWHGESASGDNPVYLTANP